MPYLQLDLPGHYPAAVKCELAARLCKLYARVMETQTWRPNVGIRELGRDNLFHLGPDGLEPVTMVLVEIRRGRSTAQRLELAKGIADACVEVLAVPRHTVLVEFTLHDGDEMFREGRWVGDWTASEAVTP
jgi:phenylpyruvate tautomerase PptA (4-oxalocrotonate tautomerase family)